MGVSSRGALLRAEPESGNLLQGTKKRATDESAKNRAGSKETREKLWPLPDAFTSDSAGQAASPFAEDVNQQRHQQSASALPPASNFPIDFVYCWAGEAQQQDGQGAGVSDVTGTHNEGRGFGELRYSIRYLEAHAPWFNKVYILTDTPAQRPAWLTEASNDKVVMIDRCTLFPRAQDCPTKNSDACRLVMHRIPGLSEHFVSMDDDFIVLEPVATSDFFTPQGQPLVLPEHADEGAELYDEMPPGPDMPPKNLPSRMNWFHHLPTPLTINFTRQMEITYPAWYAFARSHHVRFVCCNASDVGTLESQGLDENFQRIYPHMLLEWSMGIQHTRPPFATCVNHHDEGSEQPAFLKCMMNKVNGVPQTEDVWKPGSQPKFMALQNIKEANTWFAVQSVMESHIAAMPQSALVAFTHSEASALQGAVPRRLQTKTPSTLGWLPMPTKI